MASASRNLNRVIRSYLSRPDLTYKSSMTDGLYSTMGDKMGVAILKALYGTETVSAGNVMKIIELTETAFANRRQIKNVSDRHPAVTVCMLEWLLRKRPDHEEKIRELIRTLLERTTGF